ncbi:MAG: DUF3303 family protein [Chloroflexi bacterium]|nr:DUF3303 family protein [Chloroflexota bacterium]MBI2983936.1 DUF3303 family protein [Chloroflexota bacterium]
MPSSRRSTSPVPPRPKKTRKPVTRVLDQQTSARTGSRVVGLALRLAARAGPPPAPQLMETDDARLFEQWTAAWSDLVEFEIVPVVSSAEAAARAARGGGEGPAGAR